MIAKRGQLVAPGSLLAGVALLAGGILSTFTHLSTLRLRMTERAESWGDAERSDRDAIDETAAHLLLAAYLAGVTALLIVLGMNIGVGPNGEVAWGWSAAIAVVGSYMFLLFLIAVPKLYNAYTVINRVRDELNGAVRGSRPR